VSNVANDAIASGNLNADGNALDFGFASLFGQFPGSNEVELATITFNIADDATGSSEIAFTPSSTAAGFAFDGQPHNVVISVEPETVPVTTKLVVDPGTGEVTADLDSEHDVNNFNFEFTARAETSDQTNTAEKDISVFVVNEEVEDGAIDLSALLTAAGYTGEEPEEASISDDILTLIGNDDISLDNQYGGLLQGDVLTIFADINPDDNVVDIYSYDVEDVSGSDLEDDFITATSFIA
jgi:3D (Asp-Asp-Asp) domain-containing protein